MYLYSYPSTHAISGLAAGSASEQFEIRLERMIEWIQRYTPRPGSNDFRDALGGGDRAYVEVHCEAVIEWTQRCTPRASLSEFGDSLGGHDRVSLEICTWRPWSCELAGHNRVSLEIHLEAIIRRDLTSTLRRSMDSAPGLNSSAS